MVRSGIISGDGALTGADLVRVYGQHPASRTLEMVRHAVTDKGDSMGGCGVFEINPLEEHKLPGGEGRNVVGPASRKGDCFLWIGERST
jgi:hypothetical protein